MTLAFAPRSLVAAALVAAFALSPPTLAQPDWSSGASNVVIPQIHPIVVRPGTQAVQLAGVAADVRVNEQVARTTLRLTLSNPSHVPLETELLLPVPQGASVTKFILEGLPNEGVAKVLTREEARRIYEAIVRNTRDPGLVEFAGQGFVRTSVFPVPANGTQVCELTYEQALVADGNRLDYLLPRSDSLANTGTAWSYSIRINSARAITTLYSPSHELAIERKGPGELVATVLASSAANAGSLRLSYLMAKPGNDAPVASFLAYPDPTRSPIGGGYFMMLLALPPMGDDLPGIKREITLVLDRSGSMRGPKIDQAKAAALQIIEGLDAGEAFNIVDYSDEVQLFSPRPVIKDAAAVARARQYVADIKAVGGTNIHDALLAALGPTPTDGFLPIVLFLTDGLPTVGVTGEVDIREAAIKANAHKRRVFTFGVGFDVNVPLLSHLATSSRAASTFVLPEEDVEVKVGQVFRRLKGPVLASPTLTVVGSDASGQRLTDLLPRELPDIFDADQVVLLGAYAGHGKVRVRLDGNFRGTPRSFEFDFDTDGASVQNAYVARLWAGRKIGFLIDEIRQSGARSGSPGTPPTDNPRTKELVDEIIRLSTQYGILTEYTSFLAAEDAPMTLVEGGQVLLGQADRSLMRRESRMGGGAVAQQENIAGQNLSARLYYQNRYKDAAMNEVVITGVQQVADLAFFRRDGRWVDSRMLNDQGKDPETVIEIGTDEYFKLADRLAAENRHAVLAQSGEIYLLVDAKRVLVRPPAGR